MVTPVAKRHVVEYIKQTHSLSERRACKLSSLDRSSFRYKPMPDKNLILRIRLRELAEQRRRFGAPRLHTMLRREGHLINHKRTERLYREEGLSLRLKKRKKRISHLRVVMDKPERINQHWSMDFVSDNLYNGRRFRVLTVIDDLSRECPALEADHSLTGTRVARVLDRISPFLLGLKAELSKKSYWKRTLTEKYDRKKAPQAGCQRGFATPIRCQAGINE